MTCLHVIDRDVLGVQLVQRIVQVACLAVGLPLGTHTPTNVHYVLSALQNSLISIRESGTDTMPLLAVHLVSYVP